MCFRGEKTFVALCVSSVANPDNDLSVFQTEAVTDVFVLFLLLE